MSIAVIQKSVGAPPVRESEILRYAGCYARDTDTLSLMRACLDEATSVLLYKVCYAVVSADISESTCRFDTFSVHSSHLAKNLSGCRRTVVFAATLSVGIDRLIAKYSRLSPSKAFMMQAIGAERIESLCDVFCDSLADEMHVKLRSRFSPGYGDLPLTNQKDLFSLLDCPKRLGLTLNESLLISPTKSVTAFVGIDERAN